MGLKCLLGHDYSAPEIERERVEDGEEVVTTLREVQTCARCGETRVVSENTEVTTMARLTAEAETVGEGARRTETLSGGPSDDEPSTEDPSTEESSTNGPASAETAASSQTESTPADTPPASAATSETDEGVEFIKETAENATAKNATAENSMTDNPPSENTTPTEESAADSTTGDQEDPVDDGAEILESEPAADDEDGSTTTAEEAGQHNSRERGAWPAVNTPADESAAADDGQQSWPTHDAEDEGYNASGSSGSSETDDETVAYVGGAAADDRAASTQADADTGLTRSREQSHGAVEETPLRGPTEYYCPACGMTTDTEGSSLRAGDVCPSCRGGYVAERSR